MVKNLAIVICATFAALFYSAGANAMLIAGLTDTEQSYHVKIFDYVMDNINPGVKHDWTSYNAKGSIVADEAFVSKSRSACREYTETFEVQGHPGSYKGVACRRSNGDGWCQLRPTDAQTCAMEHPNFMIGTLDGPIVTAPGLPANVNVNVPDVSIGGGSINITAPNVNMPSVSRNYNAGIHSSGGSSGGSSSSGNNNSGGNNNNRGPTHNKNEGTANDVSYGVTDSLGSGAAKGTGWALSTFNSWFR